MKRKPNPRDRCVVFKCPFPACSRRFNHALLNDGRPDLIDACAHSRAVLTPERRASIMKMPAELWLHTIEIVVEGEASDDPRVRYGA